MTLKDQITEDMKTAMRAKDSERLGTIRLLLAACKQKEVDERVVLDDVAVVAIVDKLLRPAAWAQTQGFVREQLVLGKAVVQLHHINVLRAQASFFVHRRGRFLGHAKAHHFAHVLGFKGTGAVGGHGLGADAHAGVQPMLLGK